MPTPATAGNQEQPGFRPRRLGHVNLYVGNIEKAMDFYVNVCGFEDVFREHQIKAGFVSNGTRHHDLGMVELAPRKLIGRDGEILGDRHVPSRPGLNHLAFEIDTEAELAASFRTIRNLPGIPIDMVLDHGLSKSVYIRDPSGTELEFYSDSVRDWRTLFNEALAKNAMVTGLWDPDSATPSTINYYDDNPVVRAVEHAPLHPVSVIHATMVIPAYDVTRNFYRTVGGLEELPLGVEGMAAFRGYRQGLLDVVLVRSENENERQLHHVTFGLPSLTELETGAGRLRNLGIEIDRRVDTKRKSSIFIRDPDGLLLEFAFYKSGDHSEIAGMDKCDAIYRL